MVEEATAVVESKSLRVQTPAPGSVLTAESCLRWHFKMLFTRNCQFIFYFCWNFIQRHQLSATNKVFIRTQHLVLLLKFFCSTSYLILDGFDQHYQASVHFPLTSTIDKSQQHENNFWGEWRILNPGVLDEKQECYLCATQPQLLF